MPPIVAAIAVNNFLKLLHVRANLNNLNNLSVLNAYIAEKLPPLESFPALLRIHSINDSMTITASNIFIESFK